ncbi:efflux RND transporter periplasmic adaptor subunit [Pseudomonas sp. RIT-PI-AD]|uniref:efflux RND transporter periplasmic adaptor subunit n=1 Tax=Pseudomonas sp. RIT-PI-AD TaxID=3035294 RepID=UPI0021D8B80B|nr:efflux RND transporter periplasmic adaptor subunit [Pseudomonas sp. RIT-PI-AD]
MSHTSLASRCLVCLSLSLGTLLQGCGPSAEPDETLGASSADAAVHPPSDTQARNDTEALIEQLPPAAAGEASADAQGPAVATPTETAPGTRDRDGSAEGNARGVVRAVHEATLSAGMTAQVLKMPLTEGASFKKGDLLVALDCERAQADLRAAEASMQVEQKTVETNQELEHFNSIGKFDLLISESKLNKAKAETEALRAQVKQCKVTAPFAGRVMERMAHPHESVSVSQPLLRIVDTGELELDVIVPSKWLQWLKPGTPFSFKIDETGQASEAVVDRLLPAVDPVSKTVKIIGRFNGKSASGTIPGMSGSASFRDGGA